jgi:ubiquinone/menaquinone biosynthesis C-methylase UbiE
LKQDTPENTSQWWETGFEGQWETVYAHKKQDTRREVEGIIQLLGLPPGSRILDCGCGAGRIALPLARRGYRLTGLDYSGPLLKLAEKQARRAQIAIEWIKGDMRRIGLRNHFDAAVSIFTSFGYFNDPADDLLMLKSLRRALKRDGKLVLDLENPALVLKQIAEQGGQAVVSEPDKRGGQLKIITTYNKNDKRVTLDIELKTSGHAESKRILAGYRLYTLPEIRQLMAEAGLLLQAVFGDFNLNEFGEDAERLLVLGVTFPSPLP